eukprot:3504526-Pyramimonas_sp.AAC.1
MAKNLLLMPYVLSDKTQGMTRTTCGIHQDVWKAFAKQHFERMPNNGLMEGEPLQAGDYRRVTKRVTLSHTESH